MLALQSSTLPEAAEVLDILHQVEFESLFYTHDKLAERQVRERSNIFDRLCMTLIPPFEFLQKSHYVMNGNQNF